VSTVYIPGYVYICTCTHIPRIYIYIYIYDPNLMIRSACSFDRPSFRASFCFHNSVFSDDCPIRVVCSTFMDWMHWACFLPELRGKHTGQFGTNKQHRILCVSFLFFFLFFPICGFSAVHSTAHLHITKSSSQHLSNSQATCW